MKVHLSTDGLCVFPRVPLDHRLLDPRLWEPPVHQSHVPDFLLEAIWGPLKPHRLSSRANLCRLLRFPMWFTAWPASHSPKLETPDFPSHLLPPPLLLLPLSFFSASSSSSSSFSFLPFSLFSSFFFFVILFTSYIFNFLT